LWEGSLAIASAVAVMALATYMRRVPARERDPGLAAKFATVLIAVLLITRGGMEIVLLIGTLIAQVPGANLVSATLTGLVLAIVVSWLWTYGAARLSSWLLFHVTAAFLILFCAHLFIDGIHELSESGVVAGSERLHVATEPFSSEGIYGAQAPYVLVIGPLLWGLVAIFLGYGKASDVRDADVD
jgi:FTR1 family protein